MIEILAVLPFLIHLLILFLIFLIFVLSLNLSMGYTGLFNLGHIAFFGLGAYASTMLVLNGFPYLGALLLCGILASLFSLLLSLTSIRLRGDYLAIATLSFIFISESIALNLKETNGPLGIRSIPRPEIFGIDFVSNDSFFVLAFSLALITFLFLKVLIRSKFGLILQSVRDDELASRALGYNVEKIKIISFAISAFFAGIAGSLYASYISFIDPSIFSLQLLLETLCMLIVGGMASLEGSIIGVLLLTFLPEPLRFIGFPPTIVGLAREVVFSLLLILILLIKPKGILGKVGFEVS